MRKLVHQIVFESWEAIFGISTIEWMSGVMVVKKKKKKKKKKDSPAHLNDSSPKSTNTAVVSLFSAANESLQLASLPKQQKHS